MRRSGSLALMLILSLGLVAAGCGPKQERERSARESAVRQRPARDITMAPIETNLAPILTYSGPTAIDEGFEASWQIRAFDPEAGEMQLSAAIDGVELPLEYPSNGRAGISVTPAASGGSTLTLRVIDAGGRSTEKRIALEVRPRQVIVLGGIGSASTCEGGDVVPAWLRTTLADGGLGDGLAVEAAEVHSFSYSGRYCPGSNRADYSDSDTCRGIRGENGAAVHLRGLVESLAPSKVTLIGYSMGGLTATYAAGLDPEWAGQHIASVVTFDSPLGGVPRVNLELLRLSGIAGEGCSLDSSAFADMDDHENGLLRIAATAANFVPVYTVDATDRDGPFGGIREAVPGGRAHLDGEIAAFKVSTGHKGVWTKLASNQRDASNQIQAIHCAINRLPRSACES